MQATETREAVAIAMVKRIADDMLVQDIGRRVYFDGREIVITVNRDGKEISTGFSINHLRERTIRAQMLRVAMALGASLFIQPGKDSVW